ncbi:hypothetical protein [Tautonia plasticadhaerens]|nr:hypothetical protein [Tautonia plasticadhaerens]
METKQTQRILAVGDDGREFVILEYSSYEEPDAVDGAGRAPSVLTYQTEECIPVNRLGEDLYEVLTDPEPTLARPRVDAGTPARCSNDAVPTSRRGPLV